MSARLTSLTPEELAEEEAWFTQCTPEKFRIECKQEYLAQNSIAQRRARSKMRQRRAIQMVISGAEHGAIKAWRSAWKKKRLVTCFWCRAKITPYFAHEDHIEPMSRGGAHAIQNLCISCPSCNSRKHARPLAGWNLMISEPVLL